MHPYETTLVEFGRSAHELGAWPALQAAVAHYPRLPPEQRMRVVGSALAHDLSPGDDKRTLADLLALARVLALFPRSFRVSLADFVRVLRRPAARSVGLLLSMPESTPESAAESLLALSSSDAGADEIVCLLTLDLVAAARPWTPSTLHMLRTALDRMSPSSVLSVFLGAEMPTRQLLRYLSFDESHFLLRAAQDKYPQVPATTWKELTDQVPYEAACELSQQIRRAGGGLLAWSLALELDREGRYQHAVV